MASRFTGTVLALLFCLAVLETDCRREALAAAAPGSPAVSVSLEPAEIRVGDRARLTVTVDHAAGGSLVPPEIDRGKAVVVVDRDRKTVELPDARGTRRQRTTLVLHLTSFELGEHRIGPRKIGFTDRDGAVLEIPLPEAVLRTKSLLPGGEAPMRGAKDLVRWPAPPRRWVGLALGLLLLAAAVLVGARRRRSPPGEKPPQRPPAAAPHERALRALAALRERSFTPQATAESLYQDLSSIVRRYIEERFGLRATGRTTEEFIREIAASARLAPAHQDLVRGFLAQCDLVKFARSRPAPGDTVLVFDAAERLVRETVPGAGR
jgi:hypothetical protein